MKYFKVSHEGEDGKFIDGDVSFQPKISGYYQNGKNLLPKGGEVFVVLDKSIKHTDTDFFMTSVGAFFISKKLKKIIENFQCDLDFVKAEVSYHDGSPLSQEYYLMHAVQRIDCFDYIESEYSGKSLVLTRIQKNELQNDYQVRGVKKLIIDESRVDCKDIFFIGGVIWLDPIASELLVSEIQKNNLNVRFEVVS